MISQNKLLYTILIFFFSISSSASSGFHLEMIDKSVGNAKNTLNQEKEIFMDSFYEAYKNISLEALKIKDLKPFLESAFSDEFIDFDNKKDGTYFYHVVHKNEIVGYASFDMNDRQDSAYIRQLAVTPKFWSKGIGKKLVFAIINQFESIKHLSLVTRRVNTIGVEFYKHIGFKESSFSHEGLDPKLYIGFEWNKES